MDPNNPPIHHSYNSGSPQQGDSLWGRGKKVIQPLPGQTQLRPDAAKAMSGKQGSSGQADTGESNPALELIRQKIDNLFGGEPNARQSATPKAEKPAHQSKDQNTIVHEPSAKAELAELKTLSQHRSKHQKFMQELSESGKPVEEIQSAWHNYYIGLSDKEKHE